MSEIYPINGVVITAKQISAGKRGLLEGARTLYSLCGVLGLSGDDQYFQLLNSLQSDCDDLPIEAQFRKLCSNEYLAECDTKIQQLEEFYREEILHVCEHFAKRYERFVKAENVVLSGLGEAIVVHLSIESILVLCDALIETNGASFITSNHLLLALAGCAGDASGIIAGRNISEEILRRELDLFLNDEERYDDSRFSNRAFNILELAVREVEAGELVSSKHLLIAFFREGHSSAVLALRNLGLELP